MNQEQAKQLDTVYRAIIGEKVNNTVVVKGLMDRVSFLERWRWLIIAALFGGSLAGNYLGRVFPI